MKRLTLIIGLSAVLLAQTTQAATLNATKIGQIFTTTPVAETAFQALTQFRGQFTPVNIAVTALNVLLITKIGDGINALRVQMASPLPAAQSPVGWADSESPPATANQSTNYTFNSQIYTSATLCPGLANLYGWNTLINSGNYHMATTFTTGQICTLWRNSDNYMMEQHGPIVGVITCAPGYTASGANCNLTSPAAVQWPSDGVASVKPVNGVITPVARDPDNTGFTVGDISRTGTDSYNNPVKETVTANGQNGYDYKRDTQSINPTTGEPTVQRDQYSVNGTGQVTSITSNTYNNSTVSNVNTTPSASTDALAKDATLTQTNTKLDDVKTLLAKDATAYTATPTTRTIAASLALVADKFRSKFPTVVFSDVSPECPIFSKFIPFINKTLTIDAFCTMDETIRPTLQAVSLFIYALMAALIVMRA